MVLVEKNETSSGHVDKITANRYTYSPPWHGISSYPNECDDGNTQCTLEVATSQGALNTDIENGYLAKPLDSSTNLWRYCKRGPEDVSEQIKQLKDVVQQLTSSMCGKLHGIAIRAQNSFEDGIPASGVYCNSTT